MKNRIILELTPAQARAVYSALCRATDEWEFALEDGLDPRGETRRDIRKASEARSALAAVLR